MKCIRCGHDSKYKDRSGRKCPRCKGAFAFEPRAGDPLTDTAFQNAIDAVSAEGRIRWGVEHLYYEVARRYRRAKMVGLGTVVGGLAVGTFVSIVLSLVTGSPAPLMVVLPLVAVGLAVSWVTSRRKTVRLGAKAFAKMWDRWVAAHGRPAGVIVRPDKPPPPRAVEADVADYSFDRAVICDRARTVDLLLANRFHFENNCAVLSVDGYPKGPFETVRSMLRRNPRLQVFALHDATADGCRLAHRLATDPAWFQGRVPVIDVGLRPNHAGPFEGLYLEAPRRAAGGGGVAAGEADWLSRYALELAAVRPEQVLKRLFRAINRQPEPAAGEKKADSGGGSGDGGGGGRELKRWAGREGSRLCDR